MNDDIVMIAPCGVLKFTADRVDPRKVLVGALSEGLAEVLVLGIDADGEHYAASSTGDTEQLTELWRRFCEKLGDGSYIGGVVTK